ncbi:MAG: hypothetical protein QM212_01160, partial [Bacteroidota bacterium]|nr:hypothetical protein [Bacteroidota bacterium]
NKPLRRVFGSILEGRSSLISSLNLHNQNISSIFTLFCFCFCYQIVPKLTARHFFRLVFICFSKKSQKNAVFFEKKALFLEKKCNFFALFFYNRCTATVSEPKKN